MKVLTVGQMRKMLDDYPENFLVVGPTDEEGKTYHGFVAGGRGHFDKKQQQMRDNKPSNCIVLTPRP